MSDNLLLTLLGAVGVGALVMGMNQDQNEKQIVEEYTSAGGMPASSSMRESTIQTQNGVTSLNFAVPPPSLQQATSQVKTMMNQGVPQDQIIQKMKMMGQAQTNSQKAALMSSLNQQTSTRMALQSGLPQQQMMKENYREMSKSLGSEAPVRDGTFVSYKNFEQSTPLRSPSLNLGANINYNSPSNNMMGMTDVYKNSPSNLYTKVDKNLDTPMAHGALLEGYAPKQNVSSLSPTSPQPQYMVPSADGITPSANYTANPSSFLKAIDQGNAKYSTGGQVLNSGVCGSQEINNEMLPVGTMESSSGDQVFTFDRYMTVAGKTNGWRQRQSGTVDFIRGDIPIAPNVCSVGWFQSPQSPQFLTVGAVQQITDQVGGNATQQFIQSYGATSAAALGSNVNTQFTPMHMALQATNPAGGATVQVGAFH